jgi:hypothetical protein
MAQSLSALTGAGMRVYDKVVHPQVFSKNVLYMNILRNVAHQIGATTKYISVWYGRNVGSAAGSETLTLPTAGNQQYLQGSIPMKYLFHQISITDVALQASKKSKEFLVNLLENEYNGAKNDMQRQMSRMGYGIGTGELCLLNGDPGTSGTTLTFDTPMVGKNPTDYMDVGNIIRLGSTASQIYTIATITGNTTATCDAVAAGVADNDSVYIAQSATQSNKDYEIMGLKGLIDDSTNVDSLEGIARSTYIWWKSYVDDASTQRSLSEDLMHSTFLEAKKKGDPKYALTSFDVMKAYGQLLAADRRYGTEMKLEGGFTGVGFNGIPLVADFDCPYDEMYFIDPSTLSVEDLAPISFLEEDGSILDRSSTTPAWNATLKYYSNLAISAPNKNSALRDVIK